MSKKLTPEERVALTHYAEEVVRLGEWANAIKDTGDMIVTNLCPFLGLDPEEYRGSIEDLWRQSYAGLNAEAARLGLPPKSKR